MRFTERMGYRPVSKVIQREAMSDDLRVSLWNVFHIEIWGDWLETPHTQRTLDQYNPFTEGLWRDFLKTPVDERGRVPQGMKTIRAHFFGADWGEIYDFVEWVLNYRKDPFLIKSINDVLARELAGYRFVGEVIAEITDEEEVKLLEEVLADDRFAGVQAHLKTALQHLSNREKPDYRNSIKESISAVESLAQVISGKKGATLGDALAEIEKKGQLHGALKKGFSALYGYTSGGDGIRHAMMDEPNLGPEDAKFFLLSCASFINYLKAKM